MILFEKTDSGLDVRVEEKQDSTIYLPLRAWVCLFLGITKAKLESLWVSVRPLRVNSVFSSRGQDPEVAVLQWLSKVGQDLEPRSLNFQAFCTMGLLSGISKPLNDLT